MTISNVIKSIQDIMRMDRGVDGDAQRISQLVWMLFLKVYDYKESEWEILEDDYESIIPEELRWRNWAQDEEGITGDELLDFVNDKLFKTLKDLAIDETTEKRKAIVRDVFEDSYNYMKSGTLMRQVINKLNEMNFDDYEERHMFNDIYEGILKDLQSAGNAGEFYTPRAVTEFIIQMLNPQIGENIADFACGTGGFLVSALEWMKKQEHNTEQREILQHSIYGIEKKQLPHLLCVTNLILHDIDTPNIMRDNALTKNVRDYTEKDRFSVIAMNPPFGGTEEKGVQINFPTEFRTSETADLFMVLIMFRLKENGRAGVVLPDGFLFGNDNTKTAIKEKLLNEFNLHTIVRLPNGVFAPYTGINTNLLFFDKIGSTKEIWFYEHQLPEGYKNYTKTRPIRIEEFDAEKDWWNNRIENEVAWKVSKDEIIERGYNLDIKNPNVEEENYDNPEIILQKYHKSMNKVNEIQQKIINELMKIM